MNQESIRILCVFSTLDRGGAESMCMNLYRNIDRDKVQFDFVKHTSAKGHFEDEIISLGGRIFEAPRYRIYNSIQYKKWWKRHLTLHPEHHIIHCHYFTMTSLIAHAAKKENRILISHAHTSVSDKGIKRILQRSIEKYSDYCFACSQAAGKWLYPHREFYVLNNAVETSEFAFNPELREQYRAKLRLDDLFVIGTVANFSDVKNPFGLIDIFKAVHTLNPKTKLLWVGDGGLRTEIEQKLRGEGLSDSVILTGTREDVPALLQAMDIFLLPSFYEGLPVVLIEAQAAGLPCFVSDTVTKEANITGLCHYLPLDNLTQWTDTILSDCTKREDTSQQIIDAGYDIHTTAEWLQEFYMHLAMNW